MVKLLKGRLLARGHKSETIDPIFSECNDHLSKLYPRGDLYQYVAAPKGPVISNHSSDKMFFHLPYHPKDISRSSIQEYYTSCCNKPDENGQSFPVGIYNRHGVKMRIPHLTVAYSRPKNLRDLLNPTKLSPPPNSEVSSIIDGLT